jgi:putative ATPase
MEELGYGKDYKYAHDFPGHFVQQQYLPDELIGKLMWEPQENAQEAKLKERMKLLWGEHKKY